jgi:putative ABC transport system permease protein
VTEPRSFRRLLRLPLFRAKAEDVDDEIRFHLETRTELFMTRGLSREDAESEARHRFGIHDDRDLARIRAELTHSAQLRENRMRARDRIDTAVRDLQYALRGIRRQPGFAAAVVLTLALAIGATTAIYGVVRAVLLRPLPYAEADRVVVVWNRWTNWPRTWLSEPEANEYARLGDIFQTFAAYTTDAMNLTGGDGDPERLSLARVAAPFFAVTGVRPIVGRAFTAAEDVQGGPRVVMLSAELWRRRFAGDPTIVGKTVTLDGAPYQVVGILPDGFRLPLQFAGDYAQAFVPIQLGPPVEDNRATHYLNALARLRPGVTVAQAVRRMTEYLEQFKRERPNTYGPDFGVTLVPVAEQVRGDVRPVLLVLLGAVSFVLLIGCANVANLLLSRAEWRQREIAVRTALGAGRGRIAAQLLTESVVFALAGGVLGLALAAWLTRVLATANLANLPRAEAIGVDGGVLAFAAAASVLTGLLFGLAPVGHTLQGAGGVGMWKHGRGSTAGRQTSRTRSALVAAEIALAVVATAGAVLMARSFVRLSSVSPGFAAENVLTFRVSAPASRYPSTSRVRAFYDRLLAGARAVPGVRAAGAVTSLPLTSQLGDWGVAIEGAPPTPHGRNGPAIDWQSATPGYLEAMRIAVIRGRAIHDRDRRDGQPVVVISEAAARRYFPNQAAIGGRIRLGGQADTVWRTIVGITRDVRHGGLDKDPRPEMYIPHAQFLWSIPDSAGAVPRSLTIVVRTVGDPAAMTSAMRTVVRDIDPELPLAQVRTLEQVLERSVSTPRVTAVLLGAFGALALVLSAIGVYGVTSYSVARRTNEIGIRIALGAQVGTVVRWIVWRAMRPAGIGLALGLAAAYLGTRLMQQFLYEISPTDPVSLGTACVLLLAIGALASWLPARRAAAVDPLIALRTE